ncbi:MAG: hypothetical protein A3A80_01705 [Candidatus Terrybacteria bacterium RIFCSPLOWO2_01_FULL_44_24]|uniref:Uncharacterized protein n=1 Tax=Candidatus Terrybacteria bacterium RIFCSPHIGHO2_01_FULL_43_35 TaxID=1802361 RepID=A0A1G2PFJ8_9BACT|nr:MAG: hypothetical protein A2828_04085 [Candidatus Terrybacteria bacterium RIFCSPHIGHO2_01_FULL_43_35]OHA49890.1 MAG: hypothetical protein A3B75_03220 [Candidatus Terrybacteria bacterium RIFCSPHIGHO2_02_FULL_43_14]OHA51789.1 MAG: hypothetical protein A3A80_01705 [Candidatus Terrybacteria bacterium RIFCSPLOWO2_01_FULL_44_24]
MDQGTNQNISAKEAYDKRKKDKGRDKITPNIKNILLWAQRIVGLILFVGAIVGGIWFIVNKTSVGHFSPLSTCITSEKYHIHSHLVIKINGQEQPVPGNVGTLPCVLPIHTHENDGRLHVENDFPFDATLGEFFGVWKKTFNRDQLLDSKADDSHEIVMTVDNQPSDAYGNLVLKDGQEIVIEYREKK